MGAISPVGSFSGTVNDSACKPADSHEITVPSACSVDRPFATTGELSPFRYRVKRSEMTARSVVELCGTRTPLSVIVLFPGLWKAYGHEHECASRHHISGGS